MAKLKEAISEEANSERGQFYDSVSEEVTGFSEKLVRIADKCMPKRSIGNNRTPVFWWSEEIPILRRQCNRSRREYQHKRRKESEAECEVEAEKYKTDRRNLVFAIKREKKRRWQELQAEVDRDPWGRPYKIVMQKLNRKSPIIGEEMPGRVEKIIEELFPRKSTGTVSDYHFFYVNIYIYIYIHCIIFFRFILSLC